MAGFTFRHRVRMDDGSAWLASQSGADYKCFAYGLAFARGKEQRRAMLKQTQRSRKTGRKPQVEQTRFAALRSSPCTAK